MVIASLEKLLSAPSWAAAVEHTRPHSNCATDGGVKHEEQPANPPVPHLVRLVDEQDAAPGSLHQLLHHVLGLADEGAHHVHRRRDLDVVRGEQPEAVKYLADDGRDRGLARAGVAQEHPGGHEQ